MIRRSAASLLLLMAPLAAWAGPAEDCAAAQGTYLVGTVTSAPLFQHGKRQKSKAFPKGVELSHTHFGLRADGGNTVYDVAADNVFASGYDQARNAVPAPLNQIQVGDRVEVCGAPFPGGIHWVHTDCGDTPRKGSPNGWVKLLSSGGTSVNMEGSEEYCGLWPKKKGFGR